MLDIGNFTLERAHLIINTLYTLGVRYFCVAPGSRSTPLALAFSKLPKECRCVHFDERGLGFHALGFAKASKTPVVIIVTTGTAVANLFPSIAEASLSRVPLILLSADRPSELRDCGANQTMNQAGLFKSFTRWDIDLPLSDPLILDSYILSTLSYAVSRSLYGPAGPVQINCMIREPFFSESDPSPNFASPCVYEPTQTAPPLSSFKKWAELFSTYDKGIILLGSLAIDEDTTSLLSLAEKMGWPIFSDVLSGGRQIGDHPYHIEHPEIFLKTFPSIEIEAVLQIGGNIVSKTLTTWLNKQTIPYFLVTDHPFRQDPHSRVSYKMECKTDLFCETISSFLVEKKNSWVTSWKDKAASLKKELDSFFLENKEFSEPSIAYFFKDFSHLFLSNSMPVRDADLFLFAKEGTAFITANRGVSGIDGNIATAIGVAKAIKQPLVALLGDLATLHDLNSFALLKESSVPIFFIIINNQGGGIFSFLPVAKKEDVFDEIFATEHSYSFEAIAKTFSIPFFSASSSEELNQAWEQCNKMTCIIECKTVRKENVFHHETIYKKMRDNLCYLTEPSETLTSNL
ncbi:MAG: 2-succinyl-5-enolpyruvyl-6-hydroxy-3-cyclohexene-1-carboxylic-acid synthase [Chlamydiota bacterium]